MTAPVARTAALAELVAPWSLAAVALLALNDHVLKRYWPGALSGKLSDVALCFVLPLYLSALAGLVARGRPLLRLTGAAILTAALFTALELSQPAGALFCQGIDAVAPALGLRGRCRMTRDPTDLLALGLLPLGWLYGRRRLRAAKEIP